MPRIDPNDSRTMVKWMVDTMVADGKAPGDQVATVYMQDAWVAYCERSGLPVPGDDRSKGALHTIANRMSALRDHGLLEQPEAWRGRGEYLMVRHPSKNDLAWLSGTTTYVTDPITGTRRTLTREERREETKRRKANRLARKVLWTADPHCSMTGLLMPHWIHGQVDHWKPVNAGGDDPGNLSLMLAACNAWKGKRVMSPEDMRAAFREAYPAHPMDEARASEATAAHFKFQWTPEQMDGIV